ncbi:sugar phosphate isomerase/epimerase [Paenibacillus sp. J5C_2022]|uniref:sugar phosphate isomerase/epimerase family protein n=1 Tax=Paenibacillus sp. J5C2022 TaxID=2977129 RepID=UPI0021D38DC1|nr:sugar phosphate isomerase/epimerase family protein [Paenibacillus sp. J5C2022]MCU6711874.1 sugar phosphate isomerase/epimerase [Paenibacillus sp. J5C2022]
MTDTQRTLPEQWLLGTTYRLQGELALEDVANAGLQCIELTFHGLDMHSAAIRRQLEETVGAAQRHGLAVWSMHLPFGEEWDPSTLNAGIRDAMIGNIRDIFQLAQRLGIGRLVYHPSYEPIRPEEREERIAACISNLHTLGTEAQSHGVRLAVECLPRTCLANTASEMARLLEAHPGLGICCDVNHLLQEPPEQFIRKLGASIVTTHISDNDGMDEKHWLPGKGVLSWNAIIRALSETGYQGAFMYELRDCPPDRLKTNWQRLLEDYRAVDLNEQK